ncbi:MAG: hypothetical protein QG657_4991 [Acidobacteriota bacterium]|nr:hypothetical protein [Acidobacteriota bacterium]
MIESSVYGAFKVRDVPQVCDLIIKNPSVFSVTQSGQLMMNDAALDKLSTGMSLSGKNFAMRRLKFLFHRCSKGIRERRISIDAVNRLSSFCLEIIPLIENTSIVMPTAAEFSILIDWYLDRQERSQQEPGVVLTTVCPDYPYEWVGTKAMFTSGEVGSDIGLVGESIMKTGPHLLYLLAKSLDIPLTWIVGYAGFEAKPANLESMNISSEEFRNRLEKSARKLQHKLGVPVGILPDSVDITMEQFSEIRESFLITDFNIRRKGMDALSGAVDARDWASVFSIANKLNAIILDGASVYMGRKAYKKAGQILQSNNHTPCFYCVTRYMGFDS